MKSFRYRRCGFTVLEIMIVVLIMGILMLTAVPTYQRLRNRSQASILSNDMRQIRDSFERYALEHGDWPAEVGQGVLPPEMSGYLVDSLFTEESSVSGRWDYDGPGNGSGYLAVSLVDSRISEEQIRIVDEALDDGDPTTGNVQLDLVATGALSFIIDDDS